MAGGRRAGSLVCQHTLRGGGSKFMGDAVLENMIGSGLNPSLPHVHVHVHIYPHSGVRVIVNECVTCTSNPQRPGFNSQRADKQ